MDSERFMRGIEGLGVGIAASIISRALPLGRRNEDDPTVPEAIFNTSVITATCIYVCVYMEMPALVPIVISSFYRLGRESIRLHDWASDWFKKE